MHVRIGAASDVKAGTSSKARRCERSWHVYAGVNPVTLPRPEFGRPDYPRQVLSRTRVVVFAVATLTALSAPGAAVVAPTAAEVSSTIGGSTVERRASADDPVSSVLAISIDGLNPSALRRLGRKGTPHLHEFARAGASTLNARTEYEQTVTLPNHTGMVTGRRITATKGGHGVTWNDDRPTPATVQEAAGHGLESVFSVISQSGGSTALFASKTKFSLWQRSWPQAIDRVTIIEDNADLVDELVLDLSTTQRDFRFLHLSLPDVAGHDHGFMSRPYLRAVRRVDRLVGEVVHEVMSDPRQAGDTSIVLTSDHGGMGAGHSAKRRRANYRVPFMVRGPGIVRADLYELNPDYRNPRRGRPGYGADRQPVRNGAVANLSLDLLGLGPVPDSEHDVEQDLDVTRQQVRR